MIGDMEVHRRSSIREVARRISTEAVREDDRLGRFDNVGRLAVGEGD